MTAAIHAFAALHNLPLDRPGVRRAAVDIIEGDLILDPTNETFLPQHVWVEGAYTLAGRTRVMVVRGIDGRGHLGDRQVRTLPEDTVVTVWEGPTPDAIVTML